MQTGGSGSLPRRDGFGPWLRAGIWTPLGRTIILLTLLMMVTVATGYLYLNIIRYRQIEKGDAELKSRNNQISLLTESLRLMEQSFDSTHDILFYDMLFKSGGLTLIHAKSYISVELLEAEQAQNALSRFLSENGAGLSPDFRLKITDEIAAHEAALARVHAALRDGPQKSGPNEVKAALEALSSLRQRHDELGGRLDAEVRRRTIDFDHYAKENSNVRNDIRNRADRGVVLLEMVILLMGLMEVAVAGRAAIVGRALDEEREKYKKLMEHAGDAVIVTDADTGLMMEINRKGEEMIGMRREDIVGQPHATFFPPAERERYAAMFAARVAEGTDDTDPNPKSITILRPDGLEVSVDLRCSMITVEGHRLLQGIYRDMTAQRAHEKMMEQQAAAQMELVRQTVDALEEAQNERKAAEEANRLKSEFVANMSHELRTPLTSVLGYSRIARERMDEVMGTLKTVHHRATPGGERNVTVALTPAELDEMASRAEQAVVEINMFNGVVVEQGERLLQLINDLLDMSSLEAGQLKMQEHVSSARMILHSVSSRLAPDAQQKKIRLVTNIEELRNADIFFLGDTSRLEQTLYNLIQNAIKYSGGGEVRATAATANGHLCFRVQDEGIGIPEKHREVIFDAFRQLDGASTRAQGGVGLGLTLCRKLITAMGGTISVQSTEGKGSEFTVTLPYRPVES